jgi:hypothetical protein
MFKPTELPRPLSLIGVLLLGAGLCSKGQSTSASQNSSRSKPGYTITVAGPSTEKLGTPINVVVTVTNITSDDLYWSSDIGKDSSYKAFHFYLLKSEKEVPTTFLHRKLTGTQKHGDPHEVAGGSSVVLAHPPGKMFDIPIDLSRLYEITEPGTYTVQVSRYDGETKSVVRSNILTIDIVPESIRNRGVLRADKLLELAHSFPHRTS